MPNKKIDYDRTTRAFDILLYEDDKSHQNALKTIVNYGLKFPYQFAAIKHDRDVYENDTESHKKGDIKKAHYHIVLDCKNPTYRQAIANKLKIDKRFIEPCEKKKASLLYLVHFNQPKAQYDISDLFGDSVLIRTIADKVQADNPSAIFILINDFIANQDYISLSDFNVTVTNNGWYSVYRSNAYIINATINQHNNEYFAKNNAE